MSYVSAILDPVGPGVAEHRFAAMGTMAHIVVVGGPAGLVRDLSDLIDELENRWSRFRFDSELSKLNRRDKDLPVRLSPYSFQLVEKACSGWRLSDGAFDPTILTALEEMGYDRPFNEQPLPGRQIGEPVPAPGCAGVVLDDSTSTVHLPRGVRIDPGGIGKGLAADIVAGEGLAAGAEGVLVNLGGDLVALGHAPTADAWTVSICEPTLQPEALGTISFESGAIATSCRTRRVWTTNDGERHHLIDPSSGSSHADAPLLVTVVAQEGWVAEVATKVHMASAPVPAALAGVPAVVIHADRGATVHAGMEAYLS